MTQDVDTVTDQFLSVYRAALKSKIHFTVSFECKCRSIFFDTDHREVVDFQFVDCFVEIFLCFSFYTK